MLSHYSSSVFVFCSMAWNKLIIVEKRKSFMDDQNEIDTPSWLSRDIIIPTILFGITIVFSYKLSFVDTFQSRMLRNYKFWPDLS